MILIVLPNITTEQTLNSSLARFSYWRFVLIGEFRKVFSCVVWSILPACFWPRRKLLVCLMDLVDFFSCGRDEDGCFTGVVCIYLPCWSAICQSASSNYSILSRISLDCLAHIRSGAVVQCFLSIASHLPFLVAEPDFVQANFWLAVADFWLVGACRWDLRRAVLHRLLAGLIGALPRQIGFLSVVLLVTFCVRLCFVPRRQL